MKCKFLVVSSFILIFLFASFTLVSAKESKNMDYIYDYWGNPTPTKRAHELVRTIDHNTLNLKIGEIYDLMVTPNYNYILLRIESDTGNDDALVITDKEWKVQEIITRFNDNDRLKDPKGVFVDKNDRIYIADTGNYRVVVFKDNHSEAMTIVKPINISSLEYIDFRATKLVVDNIGHIYVIVQDFYEGIIELDADGNFIGFIGKNLVKVNLLDYFWKVFSTKAQRAKMKKFLPEDFKNLAIDENNFIYTVSEGQFVNQPVKLLNYKGDDILLKNGYHMPYGDLTSEGVGAAKFVSIAVNEYGVYSVLDNRTGRAFTYSKEGELLYVIGNFGQMDFAFSTVTDIAMDGFDIIVVDGFLNEIYIFKPNSYGENINNAVKHTYLGDYSTAAEYWEKVLRDNANYEIAYNGLGKELYYNKDYKKALEMFKLGNNKAYYSLAYQQYLRDAAMKYFNFYATVLIIGLAVLVIRMIKAHTKEDI